MAREDPALTRHIKDVWPDLEHLFTVGEHVGQLRQHEGWKAVQTLLQAEIDAINAQMEGGGGPLEQAEYAVRHGRIGGLKAAIGAADAIVTISERRFSEQQAQHEGDAEPSPGG